MFKKVLVANRGEIAVRVMKGCQELGVETVAVYSEVDKGSPHVQMADQSVCIGPPAPAESYLNIDKIIQVARDTGADAIHPGYGFLSENPRFAARCEEEGIVFIGPSARVIELMGNKIASKATMERANIPVIPGYHGKEQGVEQLVKVGEDIGYPLMVKAAAGGGGKGMHIVREEGELADAIEMAKRESKSAFGDDTVFLERYISEPRHIEFQILGDNHGKVIHLFERECSIQRRHQKVIEETPSTALDPEKRRLMGETAVAAAKAIGYTNAGTVEFMYSGDGSFYFLEMNTRLQVEHPITEATTGVDLVKWQLRIASGEELTLNQGELSQRGHAIECRIYAEDPERDFMPSPGTVYHFATPDGINVRHDTGIQSGQEVTPFYDPMLAKLIVHGENREDSIRKMAWALSNYVTLGVTTNIAFLREIVQHDAFKGGRITTHFIDDHFKDWRPPREIPDEVLISAAVMEQLYKGQTPTITGDEPFERDPHSPWTKLGKWRVGGGGA